MGSDPLILIPWTGLLIFAIVILSFGRMHGLINRVIDLFVRQRGASAADLV